MKAMKQPKSSGKLIRRNVREAFYAGWLDGYHRRMAEGEGKPESENTMIGAWIDYAKKHPHAF